MMVTGDSSASPKVEDALRMAPGFGLIPGVIVDQHFAERGRIGRLIGAVAQNPRLLGRGLDEPDKNWKFDAGDLDDRMRWGAYTAAYRDVLARTSAEWAPWYVVPADKKKVRNHLVADVLVRTLEAMAPKAPALPSEKIEAHRAALDAQLAGEGASAGGG